MLAWSELAALQWRFPWGALVVLLPSCWAGGARRRQQRLARYADAHLLPWAVQRQGTGRRAARCAAAPRRWPGCCWPGGGGAALAGGGVREAGGGTCAARRRRAGGARCLGLDVGRRRGTGPPDARPAGAAGSAGAPARRASGPVAVCRSGRRAAAADGRPRDVRARAAAGGRGLAGRAGHRSGPRADAGARAAGGQRGRPGAPARRAAGERRRGRQPAGHGRDAATHAVEALRAAGHSTLTCSSRRAGRARSSNSPVGHARCATAHRSSAGPRSPPTAVWRSAVAASGPGARWRGRLGAAATTRVWPACRPRSCRAVRRRPGASSTRAAGPGAAPVAGGQLARRGAASVDAALLGLLLLAGAWARRRGGGGGPAVERRGRRPGLARRPVGPGAAAVRAPGRLCGPDGRGRRRLAVARPRGAAHHFSQALLLARSDAERDDALYNLGNAHYAQEHWLAAAQAWRTVLRSRPGDARAAANLVLPRHNWRGAPGRSMQTDLRGRRGFTVEGYWGWMARPMRATIRCCPSWRRCAPAATAPMWPRPGCRRKTKPRSRREAARARSQLQSGLLKLERLQERHANSCAACSSRIAHPPRQQHGGSMVKAVAGLCLLLGLLLPGRRRRRARGASVRAGSPTLALGEPLQLRLSARSTPASPRWNAGSDALQRDFEIVERTLGRDSAQETLTLTLYARHAGRFTLPMLGRRRPRAAVTVTEGSDTVPRVQWKLSLDPPAPLLRQPTTFTLEACDDGTLLWKRPLLARRRGTAAAPAERDRDHHHARRPALHCTSLALGAAAHGQRRAPPAAAGAGGRQVRPPSALCPAGAGIARAAAAGLAAGQAAVGQPELVAEPLPAQAVSTSRWPGACA